MRVRILALLLSAAAVAACSSDRSTAPRHTSPPPRLSTAIDLATTGSVPLYQSFARAINDSGVIVGNAAPDVRSDEHAVVWRPPNYLVSNLPDLGGASFAYSIGNDGTIGGQVCDSPAGSASPCHPAYWRNGTLHQLAGIGVVNDVCPCDGHTLVGRVVVADRDDAAIWEDDILIDIGAPAGSQSAELIALSNGYFVGQAYDGILEDPENPPTNVRSYRWSPSTGWVLIGAPYNDFPDPLVIGVNSRGTAVGEAPVLWPNGANTFTPIADGRPAAINDSNVVAGQCIPTLGGTPTIFVPCEWSSTDGWTQLGNELNTTILGINNSNMVVGYVFDQGQADARLWTP